MLHACFFREVRNQLALLDLAIRAAEIGILHAKHAVRAVENVLEGLAVRHVALHDVGAKSRERLRFLARRIACQGANLPPVAQKGSGDAASLAAGRAGYHHNSFAWHAHGILRRLVCQ